MKFAVVDGERREAQPGQPATCPVCESAMIAKCGEHRVHHWAHRGVRMCDTWWEPETEWHRSWKNRFPKDWQEVICFAAEGEKHIADVATASGITLEFQHSHLRREEREARESFYPQLNWIVDGLRRIRDRGAFFALVGQGKIVRSNPLTILLPSAGGALLRDWGPSRVPVYFDLGEASDPSDPLPLGQPVLWHLQPKGPDGGAYITPVTKASFVDHFLKAGPLRTFDVSGMLKRVSRPPPPPMPPRQGGFGAYYAQQRFARSRRRF